MNVRRLQQRNSHVRAFAAHKRRDSSCGGPPTRPLSEKVRRLLELLQGRLAFAESGAALSVASDVRSVASADTFQSIL